MATILEQKAAEIQAKRQALAEVFAQYPDLNVPTDKSEAFAADVKQRNAELSDLGSKYEALREQDRIAKENANGIADFDKPVNGFGHGAGANAPQSERKSLGQLFIESKAYKAYDKAGSHGPSAEVPLDVKTVLSESAGFAPQAIRTGQVIESAQQQPKIVDVIPSTTTQQIAVVYMRETTYTNNAVETTEGSTYGEAALAYTEVNQPIRKIAVFIPVTDEQLADIDGMQQRINNRLNLMLRQRLDSQIIAGNNSAPNLQGILGGSISGIQTQAKGTDANVDAIYKGLVKLRAVGFVEPDAVLMNPTDWQNVRLLKTSDGIYLFGFPGMPGVDRIWGLPVVQSTYVTLGTAVAGDFAGYTELVYKAGIEFEVSNSHSDFFARGQLAIRAQLRAAFCVMRGNALVTITGL